MLDVRIDVDKQSDHEMRMTLLENTLNEQPFHRVSETGKRRG